MIGLDASASRSSLGTARFSIKNKDERARRTRIEAKLKLLEVPEAFVEPLLAKERPPLSLRLLRLFLEAAPFGGFSAAMIIWFDEIFSLAANSAAILHGSEVLLFVNYQLVFWLISGFVFVFLFSPLVYGGLIRLLVRRDDVIAALAVDSLEHVKNGPHTFALRWLLRTGAQEKDLVRWCFKSVFALNRRNYWVAGSALIVTALLFLFDVAMTDIVRKDGYKPRPTIGVSTPLKGWDAVERLTLGCESDGEGDDPGPHLVYTVRFQDGAVVALGDAEPVSADLIGALEAVDQAIASAASAGDRDVEIERMSVDRECLLHFASDAAPDEGGDEDRAAAAREAAKRLVGLLRINN